MLDNRKPFDVSTLEEAGIAPSDDPFGTRAGDLRPPLGNDGGSYIRRPLPGPQHAAPVVSAQGNQEAKSTIEEMLIERGRNYGDFTDNARVMQSLKRIIQTEVGWDRLSDVQREALHMILHKIGRIIGGNPNINDHWDDIAGYAKLVSERIVV